MAFGADHTFDLARWWMGLFSPLPVESPTSGVRSRKSQTVTNVGHETRSVPCQDVRYSYHVPHGLKEKFQPINK